SCTFVNDQAWRGFGGFSVCGYAGDGQGKGGAIFIEEFASATETCPNSYSGNFAYDAAGTADDNNDIYNIGTFIAAAADNLDPEMVCPKDVTVSNDPGLCQATVDPGKATATDNCGVKSVVGVRRDGKLLTDPYPVGITLIDWTATDFAGNTEVCTQTITVKDA